MTKQSFTKGPWEAIETDDDQFGIIAEHQPLAIPMNDIACVWPRGGKKRTAANARLIAAAPTMHEEMQRFLPVLERAEADPEVWIRLTEGTGIATSNAYRAAIAKATGAA